MSNMTTSVKQPQGHYVYLGAIASAACALAAAVVQIVGVWNDPGHAAQPCYIVSAGMQTLFMAPPGLFVLYRCRRDGPIWLKYNFLMFICVLAGVSAAVLQIVASALDSGLYAALMLFLVSALAQFFAMTMTWFIAELNTREGFGGFFWTGMLSAFSQIIGSIYAERESDASDPTAIACFKIAAAAQLISALYVAYGCYLYHTSAAQYDKVSAEA